MKYIFVLTFCLIMLTGFGQDFELGLRCGAGYNLIVRKLNKKHDQYKPYYSLSNGLSFRYKFLKFLFIRTDFNHDRLTTYLKAESYDNELIINGQSEEPYDIYYLGTFDFINLYLLPGFETNGKTKFFYYNGIYFGQNLSNKSVSWTSKDTEKVKRSKNVNFRIRWGLAFGLGLKQPLGKNLTLSIESRLNIPEVAFKKPPFFRLSNNFVLGVHYKFNSKTKKD